MRITSLLFVSLSLSFLSAQEEGTTKHQQREQQRIPTTLSEAHAELERTLSPQTLARIDAMSSENEMLFYHFGLGTAIRNSWGLWADSPLAKYMEGLGFTHPDDMSRVILETFWCKRHGQDFRLEERTAAYRKFLKTVERTRGEEENRIQQATMAVRNMMMGLRFERRAVPVVRIPTQNGLNVRFICPFRAGVFLTAYCQGSISSRQYAIAEGFYVGADDEMHPKAEYDDFVARGYYYDEARRERRKMKIGDDFYTMGFYFDPEERKIHRIHVEGLDRVYGAVVVGDRAWFAGLTDGKTVLVGVGDRDRITVPLPQEDEIPDLGVDGQFLLAVYSKTIYRLTDREWAIVHSGDILMPRSGLPVQQHHNMVFFRDEGRGERHKRLWWLTMGEQLHLSTLDRNMGIVGESGPRWEDVSSYYMTSSGDLWACVGAGTTLLRRSKDGDYSIAILNGSLRFSEDWLSPRKTDQDLSVSAITPLPDDTLLLAGNTGLYRLKGNELVQELAFIPQRATDSSRGVVRDWHWNPNTILMLDKQSYVIGCDSWNGVYLLRKGNDDQWKCLPLEDLRGILGGY